MIYNLFLSQNNPINDLAILSHEVNQKWVMSSFIPRLHRKGNADDQTEKKEDTKKSEDRRPLKVEVFTIGKTIKVRIFFQ